MRKRRGHCGGRADARGGRPGRAGMTLIELMVSVAILVIMILMCNTLLIRSRRAVWLAQGVIRANADVRAAADGIRADLLAATKEGFLAVVYDDNNPALPRLVFTDVSTFRSVFDGNPANVALLDYGLTNDAKSVLWRRAFLHEPNTPPTLDRIQRSLAWYRVPVDIGTGTYSVRARINDVLRFLLANPAKLPASPKTLIDALDLWPHLISGVQGLKIQWTDGTRAGDGRLVWYDKDDPKARDVSGPRWPARDALYQEAHPGDHEACEYNLNGANVNPPLYCALWTFKAKDDWPRAIRLAMTLGDPPRFYEVILALPQ